MSVILQKKQDMHSDERKTGVLHTLNTRAGGNVSKCARLTGVDRKTIQKWKEEQESCNEPQDDDAEDIPVVEEIKTAIIRRIMTAVGKCNDPKKLMDTYDAITKFERESGGSKETLFEIIENKLTGK